MRPDPNVRGLDPVHRTHASLAGGPDRRPLSGCCPPCGFPRHALGRSGPVQALQRPCGLTGMKPLSVRRLAVGGHHHVPLRDLLDRPSGKFGLVDYGDLKQLGRCQDDCLGSEVHRANSPNIALQTASTPISPRSGIYYRAGAPFHLEESAEFERVVGTRSV